MEQRKIWDHFQASETDVFRGALPRLSYLSHRLRPGDRVLNIGIGDGSFERLAAERKILIFSLDPSTSAVEKLRKSLHLGDNAKVGQSHMIPWPDAEFDAVVMSEVLEHIDDNFFLPTMKEVRRVVRSNGKFLGTVPANERLENGVTVCPCCSHRFHRWGHVRSFSLKMTKKLLAESGFREGKAFYRAFPSSTGFSSLFKSPIRRVLGAFGAAIAQPSIVFSAIK